MLQHLKNYFALCQERPKPLTTAKVEISEQVHVEVVS